MRVPYCIGDLEKDPNVENYPFSGIRKQVTPGFPVM